MDWKDSRSRDSHRFLPSAERQEGALTGFIAKSLSKLRIWKPPLIDRGFGLIYDVDRDITWLKDANYAKTVGRTPDGQLSWDTAMSWVAGLSYQDIRGWRLPTALDPDGSGPYVGDNCTRGELGHLFSVASMMPAGSISAVNFNSYSIYWTSTEASASEAYAFRLVGLRQGPLVKDPFAPDPALGAPPVLMDLVLAWPVHDGDVGAQIASHWLESATGRRSGAASARLFSG